MIAHSAQAAEVADYLRENVSLYRPAHEPLIVSTALLFCHLAELG